MVQLKVIIVGTSPAETLRLEEALNQIDCLETFRYIGLEQALTTIPDWQAWDLLIVRDQPNTRDQVLALLAAPLRESTIPVIYLIDPYDPQLITRLLNAGVCRILPVEWNSILLESNLHGLFDAAGSRVHRASAGGKPSPQQQAPAKELPLDESYARLLHSSPIGISINRVKTGQCVECNESYALILDMTRKEVIGSNALELGLPENIDESLAHDGIRSAESDQPFLVLERKVFTRTRQIRRVQVFVERIRWQEEECTISFVQDITEKQQAEENVKRLNDELERLVLVRTGALQAANRELEAEIGRRVALEDFSNQLSQILWETPDVVAVCAPDGSMQFLNKAGRNLFGLREDEPVSHLDLTYGYSNMMRDWIREEILPKVVKDGIWRGETTFYLPGQRVIPLSQVLLCKKNDSGDVQYFAYIARDVSDFKHVEQQLRQSRERYRTLAEAAHDFIFMVSRDGVMEYANNFCCQALDFDPNKVDGTPAGQFFPKDFAANHLQFLGEVHEIDRPVYTEGPFMLKGQEFWLGTWLVPIHNEHGELVSVLGISRDITEQKKTDEALHRALLNERKLNEMRTNFFSMTSHQFRTPLSTIMLSAELLQKYSPRWDEQKRMEHLERIQEAARRLNSMLEDILVIGRTESGRYVSSPKEFDLVAFCKHSIETIINSDQNDHKFSFHCQYESLPVYHDTGVMNRLLDNLLSNAVKYSPKGSIVSVKVKLEEENILLEVADEGIGIPEHDISYLFQPFQRGSNAGDFPGTGIGLTIIQKSAELMNGSVSLKSKEGQGTTFLIRFPVRYESANRMPA